MQSVTMGAGLAALAFWGFIAAVSVAGIWGGIRKREAQQETLRRLIDSGQVIDTSVVEKILAQGRDRLDLDLKAAGLILLPIAPGLAVLAWFVSFASEQALMPMLGVALLVAFVSAGLLLAANAIQKANSRE